MRHRPSPLWLSRRGLVGALGAAALGLGLPRLGRASSEAGLRKFLFVETLGGWDVTRVFAPLFDYRDTVDMEPEASLSELGAMRWVSHPARPAVDAFFAQHGGRLAVLNGFYVPSISHHSAVRMTLTGGIQAKTADWATLLASASVEQYLLPSLVVGGINFAGRYGVNVARSGSDSQLSLLASGEIAERSDEPPRSLPTGGAAQVDAYLAQVALEREASTGEALYGSYSTALARSTQIKARQEDVQFSGDTSFGGQVGAAIQAFTEGLSRCATVNYPTADNHIAWDTHALNDSRQSELFGGLFQALLELMDALDRAPGTAGGSLAEETVIVVLSEMGRTPTLNGAGGKDHWPYGTALLMGPGVRGGQVIGGFDAGQYGLSVDLQSGELDEDGLKLGSDILGATVLTLGDVDPAEVGIGAAPLEAVLE